MRPLATAASFARLLVLLALFAPVHAAEPVVEPTTLIHAGTLLAIPGQAARARQTVVVRAGRIVAVADGYASAADLGLANASVIDQRERFVMPGLMDMHVHLTEPGGITPLAAHGDPALADLHALIGAIQAARATLRAGYTTVRNIGAAGSAMRALRAAIDSGRIDGPRVRIAGAIISTIKEPDTVTCSGADACRALVRAQIDSGVDWIKIYATCSGGKPCGQRSAPGLWLPDELDAIVATAHTRQIPVAAHAHGAAGMLAALRAGVDSIEHGSFADDEARRLMKQRGTFLVPTLAVSDRIKRELADADPTMQPLMRDFIASHPANTIAAWRAGVRIGAGSDAGVIPHGTNARELELYVEHGMPAMDALVSATVNGAALLGLSAELGTLEPGKRADLIALDGNPLQDIRALRRVGFVMQGARVVPLTP